MEMSDISTGKTITVTQQLDEREYWLDKLSGEWIKSTFPYDHPKNTSPDSRQNTSFFLTGENFSALMKLSNNSPHRLFMILLAQLAVLLYKYNAGTDIILGMPIYKQDKEGKFINTVLAIRNTFNAENTFKELLLQVRQTVIDAVKHQNYPLEVLLQELKLPYSQEDFPLFDIAILLENIHDKDYIKPINTDMLFSFRDTGQAIAGVVEYNALRYQAASVERIITHYTHLVRHMMETPDVPLRDMEILSEEEKNRVLYDFNNTAADYSLHKTIHQLFAEQVEQTPDNIALVGQSAERKAQSIERNKERNAPCAMRCAISYRELNKKSNQLAHLLREKGVKAGMIVGMLMESSINRIIGILGILKAGAAYLPIDPEFPQQRILSILDDSSVSLLLTGEKILEKLPFTSLANITAGKAGPLKTPPREQITNFDALPFPDRTLVDYQKYHRYIGEAMAKHKITLQATRGCPYNCVFCHKIWPKKHVRRSPENMFEEIMYCYNAGAKRFAFIDDVFNLDIQNSSKLFRKIINKKLDLELFFCNGLRADILRKDYIDLMVEAGTVNIDVALESGSPRIQKLIRKNLDLEKFYENVHYITQQYPQVILEVEMMLGFPTETEEEALMTLDLLKKLQWVHFPNLHVLKIYPTSDLAQLAVKHGIKEESIRRSTHLAFHELPETLPFSKAFAREFQTRLMEEYFLLKERLIRVLPAQVQILSEDELVDKYDSYLPMEIKSFQDILDIAGISMEDLGNPVLLPKGWKEVPDFNRRIKTYYPQLNKDPDAFKVLLLDISMMFSSKKETMLHNQSDEPLGLMYLLSYLNEKFGPRVNGRIFKTGVDFDSFPQLEDIILRFRPDIIGIRTLSYYKEFFHEVVSYIRHLGVSVPIVSGGPYATSEYKLVLQDPRVDVVVLGEGELTFAQLVEKIMTNQKQLPGPEVLKTIKGITFIEKKDKSPLMKKANWREIMPMDRLSAALDHFPGENPTNINQPRDLLYLISTSGSTGKPKSVMLEHRNLANLLNFQSTYTDIDFSQRVLQFASIGFDVSAQEIFSTLLSGGELNLIPGDMKTDVIRLFARITTNKISILFLPPAFLKLVFSRSEYTEAFPKTLRHIIAAGEQLAVPKALMEFLKQNQVFLHNHYGPSETHVVTTLTIDAADEIPGLPSIGKPITNTGIYILDDKRRPLPIGAVGDLYIAGCSVGRGYLNQPQLTAEKFDHDLWDLQDYHDDYRSYRSYKSYIYRTGDLARWLPDGNIEFKGRRDHQVKIRGYRIELEEIEKHLLEIDFIKEAVVIDRKIISLKESSYSDKNLVAYVVSDREVVETELRNLLLEKLPQYMMPGHFVQIHQIPLTSSGKVNRKLLPAPTFGIAGKNTAPRDKVEKKLVEIWSQVLEIEKNTIGIDANFFQLGGHSLKATILISMIHKEFNMKISVGEIFNQSTVKDMARYIKNTRKDTFISIDAVEKKEYYPLSSAQQRLYIQQQMKIDDTSYNTPLFVVLEGEPGIKKLEKSFNILIARHETLRTSFFVLEKENEAVQRIHDKVEFEIEYFNFQEPGALNQGLRLQVEIIHHFVRPFDLSTTPLLRVGLIKTADKEYILMIDMHHIITDATSLAIITREFMKAYSQQKLPPLRLQYRDFSQWQNRLLAAGEIKKQEEYWLNQSADGVPELNMPLDFPRPPQRNSTGEMIQFPISGTLRTGLYQLILETGTTLFMVLLAVSNILLSKYTRREDIVIGTAIEGRQHADLRNIIGMFVNTLAIRNHPTKNKTFLEFLIEVKENALRALENQDYQFEELINKLGLGGLTTRNPLFDIGFKVINNEAPAVEIPGLTFKPYEQEEPSSRFDLVISAVEDVNTDILEMAVLFSPDLFKRSTIEDLAKHYKEIVRQIVKNREIRLKDISISFKLSAARAKMRQENASFGF